MVERRQTGMFYIVTDSGVHGLVTADLLLESVANLGLTLSYDSQTSSFVVVGSPNGLRYVKVEDSE